MDNAYGGDYLRAEALERNLIPVVPAQAPWKLDKQRYRQRNEVERLVPADQGLPARLHAL